MTKLVYVWRRPDGTPFYVGIGSDRRPWRKERKELERVRTMNVGRVPTEEARRNMSEAQRRRKRPPCSPETRAKISAALKGRRRT